MKKTFVPNPEVEKQLFPLFEENDVLRTIIRKFPRFTGNIVLRRIIKKNKARSLEIITQYHNEGGK